ncbi:MAG: histidine triad family protein [Clostridiales bacterium]|jgi:histidine triad (HIT) family protein|nr:histidine triad family protein [Clostridiales bacterium]MDK2933963.1 histidine triad family protein [Clostridiales bacterium]
MPDCIFCKIVSKEIPASIIYENDKVVAFKDINPVAPVHILIVPKQHISSVLEIEESDTDVIHHIFMICKKLAKDLGITENGFRIVNNCGHDGGQTVDHIHFHVLGGRTLTWPPG